MFGILGYDSTGPATAQTLVTEFKWVRQILQNDPISKRPTTAINGKKYLFFSPRSDWITSSSMQLKYQMLLVYTVKNCVYSTQCIENAGQCHIFQYVIKKRTRVVTTQKKSDIFMEI